MIFVGYTKIWIVRSFYYSNSKPSVLFFDNNVFIESFPENKYLTKQKLLVKKTLLGI